MGMIKVSGEYPENIMHATYTSNQILTISQIERFPNDVATKMALSMANSTDATQNIENFKSCAYHPDWNQNANWGEVFRRLDQPGTSRRCVSIV